MLIDIATGTVTKGQNKNLEREREREREREGDKLVLRTCTSRYAVDDVFAFLPDPSPSHFLSRQPIKLLHLI